MAFRPGMAHRAPRITPSQWGVLMMLEGRSESTVKDVAKALGITSSAATGSMEHAVNMLLHGKRAS
jgi:DNA-binding MarR family transcriptional regulator